MAPLNPSQRTASQIELIKFYHGEIAHEFGLLNSRMGWFVVVQSFLLAAFAQSYGYRVEGFNWFALIVLPLIGGVSSLLVIPGIWGACEMIEGWLQRKRSLCNENRDELCDFMYMGRDHQHVSRDSMHKWSQLFAKLIPLIALSLWIAIFVFSRTHPLRLVP